jgi:hypothetical protein
VIVCGLGLVSNTEAKRLGLRGQISDVDCSKNLISLEFFANFLFQDNCVAINEAKNNKQKRVKKLGWFGVATPRAKPLSHGRA